MGGGDNPVDPVAAAAGGGGGGPEAIIHIRCSNGTKLSVRTGLGATVRDFKAALSGQCDVPAEQQRLIYKGRILKDEQTLESYGLESEHTVHLVRSFASPEAPAVATNLGASRSSNNNTGAAMTGAEGGGFGGARFPGISANGPGGTEASGLFGFGFPDFDQVHQQLTQNPNMMREIMNMPAIQSLMNNPELIRNLIMSNPQMRELIDRNPDIAHVLNDPRTLQQTLEAARNPELMREMMRNTDRAMSNIESSPEGFNMLRRMYETVQEPFLNATTMGGNTESNLGSNPFAALSGNRVAAQVRDQSLNPSTANTETATVPAAPNTNPLPNPWNSTSAQTTNLDASDVRTPGSAGFGLPDPSLLNQVAQNPAMQQMMQSLLSDPQFMNQILGLNPQFRSMLESNTQMRDMLQNPDFISQLTSPETVQQLLSLQQSLLPQLVRQQTSQDQNQAGSGTGTPNMGLDFLMNMFGGLGAGGFGAPNASNVPPEELYATQLSQLQEMGFLDTQENIRALTATSGNVHAAVERLLRNLGQ